MNELSRCKVKNTIFEMKLDNEILADCDYLAYVIKESLRMDSPSMLSTLYSTYEDVEVCGVKIPKDTITVFNMIACHFNPDQWQEPKKFIPERFDPTSEYFTKPGTGNS